MLNADSPDIKDFVSVWHELNRNEFEVKFPNLDYDANPPISAHTREQHIEIVMLDDYGRSYKFLVDRLTHEWVKGDEDRSAVKCIDRTYSEVQANILRVFGVL